MPTKGNYNFELNLNLKPVFQQTKYTIATPRERCTRALYQVLIEYAKQNKIQISDIDLNDFTKLCPNLLRSNLEPAIRKILGDPVYDAIISTIGKTALQTASRIAINSIKDTTVKNYILNICGNDGCEFDDIFSIPCKTFEQKVVNPVRTNVAKALFTCPTCPNAGQDPATISKVPFKGKDVINFGLENLCDGSAYAFQSTLNQIGLGPAPKNITNFITRQ